MHAVFFGPEGSGKGTQARLLAKKFKVPHLVSGGLVRKYAKEDKGIMGRVCKEALDKGHYVADSEMYVLWKQRFKEDDAKNGWIIDGFPRNVAQARFLERKVEKYDQRLDAVFYLRVPEEESVKRLVKRGRKNPDGTLHDTPKRIKERLRHYNRSKERLIGYYKKRGILKLINGNQSIKAIHKDILKKLEKIQNNK